MSRSRWEAKTLWYVHTLLLPYPSCIWEGIFPFSCTNLVVVGIGGSPRARLCSSGEGEELPASELKDGDNKRDTPFSRAKRGHVFEEGTSPESVVPVVSDLREEIPPSDHASTEFGPSRAKGAGSTEVCLAIEEVRRLHFAVSFWHRLSESRVSRSLSSFSSAGL